MSHELNEEHLDEVVKISHVEWGTWVFCDVEGIGDSTLGIDTGFVADGGCVGYIGVFLKGLTWSNEEVSDISSELIELGATDLSWGDAD